MPNVSSNIFDSLNELAFNSEINFSNIPNLSNADPEINIPLRVNFDYYTPTEFKDSIGTSIHNIQSSLSVLHSNVRSIQKNFDNLHQMLFELDHPFDIIGISESWINTENTNVVNIDLPNFSFISQPTEQRAGGVGFYIKNSLTFHVRNDMNKCTAECEMLWIEISNDKQKNLICGVIYRHPNSNAETFLELLTPILEKINSEGKFCIILGDFNFNLLNYENHYHTEEFLNTLNSNFFEPHITKPTRVTDHTSTLIDNIFFNSIDYDCTSGNIIYNISDHLPNFLIINEFCSSEKNETIYRRDFTKFDKDLLIDNFKSINWIETFQTCHNVDDMFKSFFDISSKIINTHIPLKKASRKEAKFLKKPWISKGLQTSIKKKSKLYRQYLRNRNNNSSEKFKSYRNMLNTLLKKSKQDYYKEYFKKSAGDAKATWNGIRELVSLKKKKKTHFPSKIIKQNITITDQKEIVNEFNEYFATVGKQLASSITSTGESFKNYLGEAVSSSLFLSPTSASEISKYILTLNNNKATGPYSLPVFILKSLHDVISVPLEIIYNHSFATGTVPSQLKVAKVMPIFKKDSPLCVSNYRPISLLSIFNKILEKLVYQRLSNFFEKQSVIYDKQFGFRAQHSTAHALLLLTEKIRTSIDKGLYSCGIFLDLQKAFDTVDHSILLNKLSHYGVRGLPLQWFTSYLSNRKQFVCIDNVNSNYLNISCGVPQGSVLGPLLFLIYVNDFYKCSQLFDFHLFADDTNLFMNNKNLSELEALLNQELHQVGIWLSTNKLSLNIDKTSFVIFHPPQKKIPFILQLKIFNQNIRNDSFVRYLGIIFDCNLNWKKHIHELTKKISKNIGILTKVRYFVSKDVMLQLYYSFFYSLITYGILIWGNTYENSLKPIITLQKKVVRVMTFSKWDAHTQPIFANLGLLKFTDIIFLSNAIFMFQFKNNLLPKAFDGYFQSVSSSHNYRTRLASKSSFRTPVIRTNYGKFNLSYVGPTIWNNLDENIKLLPLKSFKAKMKTSCLEKY